MASEREFSRTEQRLRMIAFDAAVHFRANIRGSGLKAQLATDGR